MVDLRLFCADQFEDVADVFGFVEWMPMDHLIKHSPNAIGIRHMRRRIPNQHLRGQIHGRPTKTIRSILTRNIRLRQPKITQHQMIIIRNQYVLRLQIPVDDVLLMQVLDREDELADVDDGVLDGELAVFCDEVLWS